MTGQPPSKAVLRVTARDLEFGDEQVAEVKAGDYLILCTEPAFVANVQAHSNGTHVITVKGRTQP
jgi:hypothetical protein